MTGQLLQVDQLHIRFRHNGATEDVVRGITFHIERGETYALVGESGSGKSVTALATLGLLPAGGEISRGRIVFDGQDVVRSSTAVQRSLRAKRIGMIFQDPQSALNPVLRVGTQIAEVLRLHTPLRGAAQRQRMYDLLDQVGLPDPVQRADAYPHQLSGGQRQRVMIAMALAGEPELLIADEPTTALDVTLQAQVLALLKRLQQHYGMALWLITHDLAVVAEMADRVGVMRNGELLEELAASSLFADRAQHPYTRELLAALPTLALRRSLATNAATLLEVSDYHVYYPVRSGLLQRVTDYVRAVDGVTFSVRQGQTLALVGESGCGKTTLAKALLGLLPATAGSIRYAEATGDQRGSRSRRGRIVQMIFQDPFASMDPKLLISEIIEEGLRALRADLNGEQRRNIVTQALLQVGLDPDSRTRYPHEFSGGQRQRIAIARALAIQPRLLVLDEPTSALDASVQTQILTLLQQLQERTGMSYLLITHDLAVVGQTADLVAVMHAGKIVELGPTAEVLRNPRHTYTQQLLAALPALRKRRLYSA